MTRSADFSPCRRFRYSLSRRWSDAPILVVIGLNPSTADAEKDDPTIRKCIGFAKRWGCGELIMVNLFAYRATKPADLKKAGFPIEHQHSENFNAIRTACGKASIVLAAWGSNAPYVPPYSGLPKQMMCLGRNKDGSPKHPLYIPYETPTEDFRPAP